MTTKNARIQLKRANNQSTLESLNPVLLAGEPAIALDTGVLKIGDGVTNYQNLPSIGAGGGGGSSSDFVDLTTNQTIRGVKNFTDGITLTNTNGSAAIINNGSVQLSLVLDSNGKAGLITTNQTDYKIYTTNNDFLLDTSMLDGTTLTYDNANNVIRMVNQPRPRNIGEIAMSTLPLTDAGLHLLDGSLLQYGIYKDFIDYIAGLYTSNSSANYFCTETEWQNSVTTYGSCGKFVYDSTNNTVRLPKVSDILQGTSDVSALGSLIEAGLPNITGNIAPLYYSGSEAYANGAFTQTAFYNTGITSGSQIGQCGTNFDASRSSSIYGNSSTVQPQTIKVLYYIVVATSVKTNIEVDIDQVATDLASVNTSLTNKASINLDNITDEAKVLMSSMGMPSETWVDLAWGASGTKYVAPADGYYTVIGRGIQVGQYVAGNIEKSDGTLIYSVYDGAVVASNQVKVLCPIAKGETFAFYWTATGTDFRLFRFIYAKGSESEAQ